MTSTNALSVEFERHAEAVFEITGRRLEAHYVSPEVYSRLWGEFYRLQEELIGKEAAAWERRKDGAGQRPRLEICGVPVKVI